MKLIVGLGNPGEEYRNTRHNVGFSIIDRLQSTLFNAGEWEESRKFKALIFRPRAEDLILLKPLTFMNQSGYSVKTVSSFYKIHPEDVWVIHDDLDIKLGEYKIQKGVGPKIHYGINSIDDKLESKFFYRVRVGVDNRDPGYRRIGEAYVLEDFDEQEKLILNSVIKQVVEDLSRRILK